MEGCSGGVREVEVAADVGGGSGVGEDCVGGGCAAADVEGDGASGLAGLDGVGAGDLAEGVEEVDFGGERAFGDESDGGGDLLERCGDGAGGGGELRRDGIGLHDDVADDDGCGGAVEILTYARSVWGGGGEEDETAVGGAADLVGTVGERDGKGGDSFALNELDLGVADGDSVGSGDGASDYDGVGGQG